MPSDGARSGGNRPGKGDWRGGGGRAARPRPGAKAAAGKEGHDWARRKTDDSAKLLWIFRAKIAFGVLLTIGLFVAIILMLPRPTTTPFISLVISEYSYPVPPNAWAYDDVENIRRLLDRDGENRTGGEPLAITADRQILWKADKEEWLGNLSREVEGAATIKWWQTLGRGPGDGAVIIYLSGLGVVDDEGRACLLLPGLSESDSVFDPARRMPVRELLDALFYNRADEQERLPRNVLKFVVLDAGRIDQEWELGLPYNAFVESLQSVVESELPVSNLFVLNSADAGQKAWPSPELGGTVFGHFVRRGLQGHADGYAADATVRDPDQFITVEELFEYVRRQTARFVATYRGDEQRPILLAAAGTNAAARDRRLVEYGASLLEAERPDGDDVSAARRERMAQIAERWTEIRREGWDRYADLAERGIRYHPLAWQRFEHMLLRLERLATAGGAKTYQDQYEDGLKKLRELANSIASAPTVATTPNGIALATALGANPHAPAANPASATSLAAAVAGLDAGKNAFEGPSAGDYFFKAQAAWRWITASPANGELEKRIDRLHENILPTSGSWRMDDEPVEIHFLRMLAAHRNQRESLAADVLKASIARRNAAERAAAPSDARVHYHARPTAALADEQRRKAEDALFVGRSSDVAEATRLGGTADEAYRRAERLIAVLADAYALRDRALAETPWLVRFRARRLEAAASSDADDKAMVSLLDLHHDVKRQIDEFVKRRGVGGLFDPADVDQFAMQTNELRGRFEALRSPIVEAMKKRSAQGSATDRLRMLDALASPLLAGADRQRLHEQARVLFGDEFRYTELAPDSSAEASVAEGRTDHHVARMLKWKRHPAMDLVDAPAADIKPGERTSLADAGRALRQRLVQIEGRIAGAKDVPGDLSLDDGLTPPTARTQLAATDLESRAAGLYRGMLPKITPADRLERFDRQRLLVWHYQRTLEDFWGPSPELPSPEMPSPEKIGNTFFHVAAQRLAALARRQDDGIDARSPSAATQTAEMNKLLAARDKAAIDGLVPRFDADDLQIKIDPKSKSKQPADHRVTIDRTPGADLPVGTAAYYLAEAADAEAAAATENATLVALAGTQVATAESRLAYDITAAARGGEQRQLPKYSILDPYEQSQRTSFLRGMVLYRGHRYRHPSQLVELTPYGCEREYEFKPPKYDPPNVTIAGAQKPRAVLLVLDCSGSMKERSRMSIAKQAVKAAIAELRAGGGDAKVGLWLYGHRTRYQNDQSPDIKAPLVKSPFATRFGGGDTRPPADVEKLVTLSNLTESVETDIRRWVDTVQEYGNTPLYYAIHEALVYGFADLKNPQNYERQILVLTDGANWQYMNDTEVQEELRERVFVDDAKLRAALRTDRAASRDAGIAPVRLDIVGYDFVNSELYKDKGWNVGNRLELVNLLRGDGGVELGAIHDIESEAGAEVSTEKKLQLLLQSLLGIYRFRIVDATSGVPAATTVEGRATGELLRLNQQITFSGRNGRFRVGFEGGVRGGEPPKDFTFVLRDRAERVLLRIHEDRRSGVFERWLQQEETFRDRLDYRVGDRENRGDDLKDTDGNPILIYPRPPIWDPATAGVKFRVATRYPDGKNNHTPQPVEALAVIQPRKNNVDPITIYDVTFEPGASVPEMNFVVPEWRDKAGDARQATLWVWFKFDRATPPLKKIRVDSPPTDPVDVNGSPVKFAVNYGRDEDRRVFFVKVTETHVKQGGQRPASMDRIKVSMEDAPARVHRCYVTGGKEVVHTFEYPERGGLDLDKLRQFNVLLTRIEDMKRGAVHVHEAENKAMLVDVPINR